MAEKLGSSKPWELMGADYPYSKFVSPDVDGPHDTDPMKDEGADLITPVPPPTEQQG